VRIADAATLRDFQSRWKLHHPLDDTQLAHAGQTATVRKIGFYHGGDPLYELADLPGVWHEPCLADAGSPSELEDVVNRLARHHQRATYGAVAALVDRPATFVMNGYPRLPRYSWVVNGDSLLPTGYTQEQMDPALNQSERVLRTLEDLKEWMKDHA
jgi:hypothetical protein